MESIPYSALQHLNAIASVMKFFDGDKLIDSLVRAVVLTLPS